jgi:hypothetical protein
MTDEEVDVRRMSIANSALMIGSKAVLTAVNLDLGQVVNDQAIVLLEACVALAENVDSCPDKELDLSLTALLEMEKVMFPPDTPMFPPDE